MNFTKRESTLHFIADARIPPDEEDAIHAWFAFGKSIRKMIEATRERDQYNFSMPLVDQIQKDIITAMKSREEARLSTLRMVKAALKNREIDKMAPLDDKEAQQVLSTLIKQRKDSIEQFTKGGRQEMADKEAAEIVLIETYLPKSASEADIIAGVKGVIAEMGSPTMKDMGTVMKNVMAKFAAQGMRVDGKVVSDAVKKELAGK
jgi:hypothetical protein